MIDKVNLSQVTLCAAASVNVAATIRAMEHCLKFADFGRAILFTHQQPDNLPDELEVVLIPRLGSTSDYSRFVLHDLVDWIGTSHCMITQWDGFIVNPSAWNPAFLECDYIGAPWPQFADGYDVGNGGFSLRSKRLMEACRLPEFDDSGKAEDVVIARENRGWLEDACGMRFADRALAAKFSFERDGQYLGAFGFHGAFNLPQICDVAGFWEIYKILDDFSAVWTDFWPLLRKAAHGNGGLRRAIRMLSDRAATRGM